ncbi:MAG: gliding motility-associated C-terminal domain-containing protein [Flavobacteriales bacterium]|nr:gliding motility-associated C-terminal domain-containing protein [Flavobacteriales bacterium]
MAKAPLLITTLSICASLQAGAQLQQWLVRTLSGEVRVMDAGSGTPFLGPVIAGFGLGGSEDVNLMTDTNGELLFCTAVEGDDKVHVRTASMLPMPNGAGLNGNESSMTSAIVPRPCHDGQYYIVHHDAISKKHLYSVVDMALNGGAGDVTQKNVPISADLGEGLAVSHQLHSGCRWMFCFKVYDNDYILMRSLVGAAGIGEPEPIDTITGSEDAELASMLKLSPSNEWLALSMPNIAFPDSADVAIWPLDLQTGTVGDARFVPLTDDPVVGIEFSPGNGYLYFAGNSNWPDMDFGRLNLGNDQVEIIDGAIGASIVHMETASNGRLYVAANNLISSLAEVQNPDAADLASLVYDRYAVFVWAAGCKSGLPNSIEGEPPGTTQTPSYIDFEVELLPNCGGHLFTSDACLASSWEWQFGDGTISTLDRPIHHYDVGTFDVTLNIEACGETLSLTQPALVTVTGLQPVAHISHPDSVCQRAIVPFTNTSEQCSEYSWRFGNGAYSAQEVPPYAYPAPGEYDLTFVAIEGCITDSIHSHITVLPSALASFRTNSDPCDEQLRLINTSIDGGTWYWEFGDGDTTHVRDPWHTYTSMDAFTITLISDRGTMCADTAQQTLYAGYGIIPVAWFIPNAFTPNGDGINDELRIKGPEVCASPVMSIFDKWGEPVWEGDATSGWDGTVNGTPVPDGPYVYVLNGKFSRTHGYIMLLR